MTILISKVKLINWKSAQKFYNKTVIYLKPTKSKDATDFPGLWFEPSYLGR